MKTEEMRDYKDIQYVVNHVTDINNRIDVLKKLGYKIGVIVVNNPKQKVLSYTYDKKKKLRIQVTPILYNKIAKCVILENNKLKMEDNKNIDQKSVTDASVNASDLIVDNNDSNTSTETKEVTSTDNKEEAKEKDNEKNALKLTHLNEKFIYELMSIPTYSKYEYRLVTFIILWARKNNIAYEFDNYGNVYLTKGELAEGEFYPCVTAHLDSVQNKQEAYIKAGLNLEVKTRVSKDKHEIYVEDFGIGGDDKAGVLINLSMFNHVDKLKACFFLEEEIGCKGSNNLNVEWFKNVGYVIGYDSPDLNRAAWSCCGVKLFSADFFKTHIKDICEKHGLTSFRSEPFTDVKVIREKTNIVCMNFGSGYYNAHMANEYCVIEDMDTACRMGHEIINALGNKEYKLDHKETSYWSGGKYVRDEDEAYFRTLDKTSSYSYYGSSYRDYDDDYYNYRGYTNTSNTTKYSGTTSVKKDVEIDTECLKYIVDQYEEHEKNIKTDIEKICEANNIDFSLFKDVFNKQIKF